MSYHESVESFDEFCSPSTNVFFSSIVFVRYRASAGFQLQKYEQVKTVYVCLL